MNFTKSLDSACEALEKARTKGAKDKRPRKAKGGGERDSNHWRNH